VFFAVKVEISGARDFDFCGGSHLIFPFVSVSLSSDIHLISLWYKSQAFFENK